MAAQTHSLQMLVLQAHRAKGVRYPTYAQKERFQKWASYALRRNEAEEPNARALEEHGKKLMQEKDQTPSGRR